MAGCTSPNGAATRGSPRIANCAPRSSMPSLPLKAATTSPTLEPRARPCTMSVRGPCPNAARHFAKTTSMCGFRLNWWTRLHCRSSGAPLSITPKDARAKGLRIEQLAARERFRDLHSDPVTPSRVPALGRAMCRNVQSIANRAYQEVPAADAFGERGIEPIGMRQYREHGRVERDRVGHPRPLFGGPGAPVGPHLDVGTLGRRPQSSDSRRSQYLRANLTWCPAVDEPGGDGARPFVYAIEKLPGEDFRRADQDFEIFRLGQSSCVVQGNKSASGEVRVEPSFRPNTRLDAGDRTTSAPRRFLTSVVRTSDAQRRTDPACRRGEQVHFNLRRDGPDRMPHLIHEQRFRAAIEYERKRIHAP